MRVQRLWIVTPRTPQRTAFEKHIGPEARPVIHGKSLDVSNQYVMITHIDSFASASFPGRRKASARMSASLTALL
jgi:hypothetical protein